MRTLLFALALAFASAGLAAGCASTPDAKPAEPAAAAAPEAKTVTLSPLGAKSYAVAPGAQLQWRYTSHGSVGMTGGCSTSDDAVVKFVRKDLEYENPEKMKAGMSGADRAKGTYVFEAVAAGRATITCKVGFRGETKRTDEFAVEVR